MKACDVMMSPVITTKPHSSVKEIGKSFSKSRSAPFPW